MHKVENRLTPNLPAPDRAWGFQMNIKINISQTLAGLLLTAALAASCTKIRTMPDTTPQEIAMKAPVMTKAAGEWEGPFGLFAYSTSAQADVDWTSVWAGSSPYLDNVAFKKQGEYWLGWDPTSQTHHAYNYPLTGSLLFAGYSPHKDASNGTVTSVTLNMNAAEMNPYLAVGFTHLTEEVATAGRTYRKADLNNMPDLMWFDVKDANSGKTVAKTSEAINVTFRHALSKVTFKFLDSRSYYKLKSVAIKDCIYESVFYSGNTAGWMPDISALADYELLIQQEKVLNNWQSGELFFIPQYLDGVFPVLGSGSLDSGVDVILSFTVTDGFGEQTVELPLKDYTPRWEMGKHYHYNVTVNAEPIDFGAPSVSITQQVVSM